MPQPDVMKKEPQLLSEQQDNALPNPSADNPHLTYHGEAMDYPDSKYVLAVQGSADISTYSPEKYLIQGTCTRPAVECGDL